MRKRGHFIYLLEMHLSICSMRKRGHFIYLLEMHLSISKSSTLLEHYQIDGNKEAIVAKRLLHQQLL